MTSFPSAKLRQLLTSQDLYGSSTATETALSKWVSASACPAQAVRLLRNPVVFGNRIVWVPPSFVVNADDPTLCNTAPSYRSAPPSCTPTWHLPPPTNTQDGDVQLVLNASFLHETSLFTLLLCHPLPSSTLSMLSRVSERLPALLEARDSSASDAPLSPPIGHYWMQCGHWNTCARGSAGETWLSASTRALNVQLAFSSSGAPDKTQHAVQYNNARAYMQSEQNTRRVDCLASDDYLENLMWPTTCSGDARLGIVADSVWVDAATVAELSLSFYADAIWVPFHPSCTFASWHRVRLLRSIRSTSTSKSVREKCFGESSSPRSPSSLQDSRIGADLDWFGELFVCPLES